MNCVVLRTNVFTRCLLAAGASLLVAVAVVRAQPSATIDANELARWRQTLTTAKGLAIEGKIMPAENLLVESIGGARNSAEWHLQAVAQLVQLISALAVDGNPGAQRAVASRALEHLQDAEKFTSNHRLIGRARQHAGLIHERFLLDPIAAKESYRRAAAADPANKTVAKALGRLEKADEVARRGHHSSGR